MTIGRWTIPVPLLPGESLSSWLARAALTQGCDPMVLTGVVWPGWRVWTLDVDRGLPQERRVALSQVSGLPEAAFIQAALREQAAAVAGTLPRYGVWPWITAIGPRNRKRKGRLAFCPLCLAGDTRPYFRKAWRFAWWIACPHHRVALEDGCPHCDAPVEPHRLQAEDRHLATCVRCRGDLRRHTPPDLPPPLWVFQELAERNLQTREARWGDRALLLEEWFGLARYLVSFVRYAARYWSLNSAPVKVLLALSRADLPDPPPLTETVGLPFELLRVAERRLLLAWVGQVLVSPPEQLARAASQSGLSRTTLTNVHDRIPPIIEETLGFLPARETPHQKKSPAPGTLKPRSKKAVLAAWTRLQRRIALVKND